MDRINRFLVYGRTDIKTHAHQNTKERTFSPRCATIKSVSRQKTMRYRSLISTRLKKNLHSTFLIIRSAKKRKKLNKQSYLLKKESGSFPLLTNFKNPNTWITEDIKPLIQVFQILLVRLIWTESSFKSRIDEPISIGRRNFKKCNPSAIIVRGIRDDGRNTT